MTEVRKIVLEDNSEPLIVERGGLSVEFKAKGAITIASNGTGVSVRATVGDHVLFTNGDVVIAHQP